MSRFRIVIKQTAMDDLEDLSHTIKMTYKSPLTSVRYLRGLKDEINKLSETADIYQIQSNSSLQRFGTNVRRKNYKKMAIIYTTHADTVFIHRIIPQTLIYEL